MAKLMVEGWFSIAKDYPDISRAILRDDVFKQTVRCLDTENIRPLRSSERIVGSFLHGIKVTGFVDTAGSPVPFFIERTKVSRLMAYISKQTAPSL